MSHLETQKNELEALSEIYYNEIAVKSSEPPISFSIGIRPQASYYTQPEMTGDDDADDDSDASDNEADALQSPAVKMMFELPPTYPDTKPSIQILDSQNLEEHEIEQLLSNLSDKCEQSLGNEMIFELVSDVVEWLSSKAEREANEAAREQASKIEALEAEERKKCDGITVTKETFLAWKAKFDAELLKEQLRLQQMSQAEQGSQGTRRLTGREMFETDKALAESDLNFVDELEQEQLEALMQSINEAELEDGDDDDDEFDEEDLDDDDDDDDDDDLTGEDLSDEDDSDND